MVPSIQFTIDPHLVFFLWKIKLKMPDTLFGYARKAAYMYNVILLLKTNGNGRTLWKPTQKQKEMFFKFVVFIYEYIAKPKIFVA